MFSNRVFQIALFVSIAAHGAIFLRNPSFTLFSKKEQKRETQINYVQPKEDKTKVKKDLRKKEHILNNLPSRITVKENKLLFSADKKELFESKTEISSKKMDFSKPALKKTDTIAVKKKIILPPINIDKINSPSYISYYQIVREKIKRAAYQNYAGEETGEIVVLFVISNAGELKELRLTKDKSSASPYLEETALASIKDASPFPRFPEELNYHQLSFNLVITFEAE